MIEVLLFANLQESIGQDKISINQSNMTVLDIKSWIKEAYHVNLESVMVAVNEEYAEEDLKVKSGDVVALIPPVSGG